MEDNAHAGTGTAVLLDIGGDVGAAVVSVPTALDGTEIEARPVGRVVHHLPHVAVVARRAPDGSVVHAAVFGELAAGAYELYVRPAGPVRLRVAVTGGSVTEVSWPG